MYVFFSCRFFFLLLLGFLSGYYILLIYLTLNRTREGWDLRIDVLPAARREIRNKSCNKSCMEYMTY